MRVAHLKRMYLLPTETFVYTQLRYAAPDQGHLICRDLDNVTMFPGVTFSAFQDTPLTWQRRWSDACYRTLRYMTAHERNFYLETIKGLGVDLLHAHYVVDAAYFIDVKRMSRLPLVVSCYGYDVSNFPNVLLGAGRRYLHPVWDNADLILAMSEDMRSDIVALGCPPEKVRVHYHGINLERFPVHPHGSNARSARILFVGSLAAERKGVEYIIRGFSAVARSVPHAELRIVGDGALRGRYEQLARSLGVSNRVTFVGFVAHDQLQYELAAADLFCHPSVTSADGNKEGIPGAIVEAMASGLPVVTTYHAGIPEMVRDGQDGFLVPERDSEAVAGAMDRLINDVELRRRLGQNAAARVRVRGDAAAQARQLSTLYEEALAGARALAGHPSGDSRCHTITKNVRRGLA